MRGELHGMKVLASCGRGGFGEVFYCEEISGRRVAVKVVSKNTPGGEWQRELEGVRNYSRITDDVPELLKIFHVEEDAECFWYTMEPADSADPEKYVPDTLAGRLDRGALPPEELFPVLSGIFRGVRAIHEAGFAHRDIKPENVIFVKGVPKLADIGLFSSLSATVTRLAGSFDFIPPEARSSDAPDSSDRASRQRNDLYAFGKVVYCAVTGNGPRNFPAVPAGISLSPLPVKLFMRLALQLCEKDPKLRLDSVVAAGEELELIRQSIDAGEDLSRNARFFCRRIRRQAGNALYRLGRWCRNNGLNVLLTAFITLLAAVIFAAYSGNWRQSVTRPSPETRPAQPKPVPSADIRKGLVYSAERLPSPRFIPIDKPARGLTYIFRIADYGVAPMDVFELGCSDDAQLTVQHCARGRLRVSTTWGAEEFPVGQLEDGRSHLVLVTASAENIRLYVDNTLYGTAHGRNFFDAVRIRFVRSFAEVSDVRVWNRRLTEEEIGRAFDALRNGKVPVPPEDPADNRDAELPGVHILTPESQDLLLPGRHSPPYTVRARCKTNRENIRFLMLGGCIIFDWELDVRNLRLEIPFLLHSRSAPGKGYAGVGRWADVEIRVTSDSLAVFVDGELRAARKGDFGNMKFPIGMRTVKGSPGAWHDNIVTVLNFSVRHE